ncbi:hypothetical protein [Metabacillus iocasae]|uniref:Uncharacterized protein n=1 Tax=Priestia iocasae TaxID=2291674 RepID=A0ABS2QUZ5_9BACI|nr:hypothetical protein [Metabacillus iocasae]MBM7703314.1 hypothetical protein [Metabacillus iocasae]
MGRGHHFNHKRQGHEQQPAKNEQQVAPKTEEIVEYSIEPFAHNGEKPVSTRIGKA